MATISKQDIDVIVYIVGGNDAYRISYEIRSAVNTDIQATISIRLKKSFSLGRSYPDAYTEISAQRKADLMVTIFRNEYGLNASIVDLIIR